MNSREADKDEDEIGYDDFDFNHELYTKYALVPFLLALLVCLPSAYVAKRNENWKTRHNTILLMPLLCFGTELLVFIFITNQYDTLGEVEHFKKLVDITHKNCSSQADITTEAENILGSIEKLKNAEDITNLMASVTSENGSMKAVADLVNNNIVSTDTE